MRSSRSLSCFGSLYLIAQRTWIIVNSFFDDPITLPFLPGDLFQIILYCYSALREIIEILISCFHMSKL